MLASDVIYYRLVKNIYIIEVLLWILLYVYDTYIELMGVCSCLRKKIVFTDVQSKYLIGEEIRRGN